LFEILGEEELAVLSVSLLPRLNRVLRMRSRGVVERFEPFLPVFEYGELAFSSNGEGVITRSGKLRSWSVEKEVLRNSR